MPWLLNFKGDVSNVFNNTYKMYLLLYLTDIAEIGVLRYNTCLCESPRLCKEHFFSHRETTSVCEWFEQSGFLLFNYLNIFKVQFTPK